MVILINPCSDPQQNPVTINRQAATQKATETVLLASHSWAQKWDSFQQKHFLLEAKMPIS